jgi:hypothetical protein
MSNTKRILLIDNDDQSNSLEKIHKLARHKNIAVECDQFNVGLPDGNDVIIEGRINLELIKQEYEKKFGNKTFHLVAFDFNLNDPPGEGIDGVTLIQYFNQWGKVKNKRTLLYSAELTEIVGGYLKHYQDTTDYEGTWRKFKTLIKSGILDFIIKDDYEKHVVDFIDKIHDTTEDFIVNELRGNNDLLFNPAIEPYSGLNFGEIADRVMGGDPQSTKFKRKLIELAIANFTTLNNG